MVEEVVVAFGEVVGGVICLLEVAMENAKARKATPQIDVI
jgi:hypothetical protein